MGFAIRLPIVTRLLVISLAIAAASTTVAWAQPATVNTCGQSVSGEAVLGADLDCSSYDGPAITINGGRLDLVGFRVTGNYALPPLYSGISHAVISCANHQLCEIVGPGELVGGVFGITANRLKLSSVTISGNRRDGVHGFWDLDNNSNPINVGKLVVAEASITDNGRYGVYGLRCKIADTTVADNGQHGVHCMQRLKLKSAVVTGNALDGVRLYWWPRTRAGIVDSVISLNGDNGVNTSSGSLRLSKSRISANVGYGVYGTSIHSGKISKTEIVDNGNGGWRNAGNLGTQSSFARATFRRSVVEGNCTSTSSCTDLYSCGQKTKVVELSCGTSNSCDGNSGFCSLD